MEKPHVIGLNPTGAAATLGDVVTFYDTRFSIGLTKQEKKDLVAFLRTL